MAAEEVIINDGDSIDTAVALLDVAYKPGNENNFSLKLGMNDLMDKLSELGVNPDVSRADVLKAMEGRHFDLSVSKDPGNFDFVFYLVER